MVRIFVMYKLKPETSVEDFKKFSKELDHKVTPRQPGVRSFDTFAITGAEKGQPPYHIIDVLEVNSFDQWLKVAGSDGMKPVFEQWNKLADESSVLTIYGEKIS